MTYSSESNNRLADKLRGEYYDRGAALRGMQATSTPELMRRAQSGSNPRVNVSEQVFDERLKKRSQAERQRYQADTNTQSRTNKNSQRQSSTQNQRTANAKNIKNDNTRKAKNEEPVIVERKLKHRQRPETKFVLWILIVMASFGLVVASCIQNYNSDIKLSQLQNNVETVKSEINDLELKLDEKNDIRAIEQLAINVYGMVKEDTLQRTYVPLSDGERIDIIEEETDDSTSGFGTVLSALSSTFSDLFEYIK